MEWLRQASQAITQLFHPLNRLSAYRRHISSRIILGSVTSLNRSSSRCQCCGTHRHSALYFVTRTETTQESSSPANWIYLASILQRYIDSLKNETMN